MAEAETNNEHSLNEEQNSSLLPAKRKSDPQITVKDDDRRKKAPDISVNNHRLGEKSLIIDGKTSKSDVKAEAESEEEEEDEDEDYEDEEEEEEEEEEHDDDEGEGGADGDVASNGTGSVDIKGKGKAIMKDNKGKGKMGVQEDSDDSDSASDEGNSSDYASDLSDDPLAEVDLDNILPSRTRRTSANRSGVRFVDNNVDGNDSDSDD